MKPIIAYFILISTIIFISGSGLAGKKDFPVLKGPYLGQKPPGITPELFAPGIISTKEKYELNSIFSLKGDEFYYVISTTSQEEKKKGKYFYIIMVSKQINGIWTKPEMLHFNSTTFDDLSDFRDRRQLRNRGHFETIKFHI